LSRTSKTIQTALRRARKLIASRKQALSSNGFANRKEDSQSQAKKADIASLHSNNIFRKGKKIKEIW
jgi:uncharacterized membrane protein YheB (UPF0754 family)